MGQAASRSAGALPGGSMPPRTARKGALATSRHGGIGVLPIVADKLEAFLRDVLGDGCYEVARGENLEALRHAQGPERSRGVALDLHVHSRTVDDRAVEASTVRLIDLHLIQEAVAGLVALLIALQERVEMRMEKRDARNSCGGSCPGCPT